MSGHDIGCEDWRRLTQALQQARVAFFEYRSGLSPDRRIEWTGTRFGIDRLGTSSTLSDLLDAVVPADRPTLINVLSLDRPGSARSGEFRIARLDGGLIDLSCDAYAEPDGKGGVAVVFGMVQDVTAQRRFENELATVAHRNHMLLAVIDACPIGIVVHDATAAGMPLIYANRRFTQLSGYEQAEVIGRDCSFLASPDTEPEAIASIAHAIRRGETIETRLTSRRRDGLPFVSRLTLAPIHDDGRLSGFIGLLHDLTHEVERQVAERHRQKMEALGRMTGGVAHELNNLLQPVALLAQDLMDRRMTDDEGRSHLEIVLDCCLKARQIIGDMLAFSRPARQRAERWESTAAA